MPETYAHILKPIDPDIKTMTLEEQLARMTKQRTELAKLLDEWAVRFGCEEPPHHTDDNPILNKLEDFQQDLTDLQEKVEKAIAREHAYIETNSYCKLRDEIHTIIGNTYSTEGMNILNDEKDPTWAEE